MTTLQLSIFACFCVNASVALGFSIRFINEKKPTSRVTPTVLLLLISSVIWSIGMGVMSVQTNDEIAYVWRSIGIFGTFMFMISVQFTICYISDLAKWYRYIANAISLLGIIVFILYIQPGQTIFVHNYLGTTFYFKNNITNIIYTLYFVLVSTNICIGTVHLMLKNPRKQRRVAGKSLLLIEFCIFTGAVFDMVVPALGYPAFPGSAITHFWGVFIFWYALHRTYRSEITVSNMSEYIYNSLTTPTMVFDSQYSLRIINDASIAFHGLSPDQTQYKSYSISDLYDTDNSIFDFEGNSITITTRAKPSDTHCELIISKIFDPYSDKIGYIILTNDLTEHELVISKLQAAKLAADSANMSKSLFLANMSHEIRTPMNAILGFSELALLNEHDEQTTEYFKDIKQSGESLLAVINQVLDISKIELGTYELKCSEYYPCDIIKDVETIIGVQARKKSLSLNVETAENFPNKLYGDKDKIRQILINILNNSVKYTNYGNVGMTCEALPAGKDKTIIRFTITDTGIGIKEEDIPHIFDKFKRVDEALNSSIEGTGLGLSITKGLIDLMEGTIEVESLYNVGSRFTVSIPQKVIDAAPIKNSHQEEQTVEFELRGDVSGKRFLVVDDNQINLKVASMLLDKLNITHDSVSGGYEAIDIFKTTEYSIILLDQMMPVIDGVETMRTLRQLMKNGINTNCKIVALTANVGEGVEENLLLEGFDAYLSKPINFESFVAAINKMLF